MLNYFKYTHLASYNFIVAGLLLLLYEASIRLFTSIGAPIVNGVDAMFTALIQSVPYGSLGACLLALLAGVFFTVRDIKSGIEIKTSYIIGMGFEAFLWAVIVYFNLAYVVTYLMGGAGLPNQTGGVAETSWLQNMSLSLGAGFYEEFFFRLILVKLFQLGLSAIGVAPTTIGGRFSVAIITAVLFSLAHFDFVLGATGEPFEWYAFTFRFVFGLCMSALFLARGFAVTAWTHAIYDVFVFSARALG